MKKCPRCDRSYPDAEMFCEADGGALVAARPAFFRQGGDMTTEPPGAERIECPVCGGRAELGEVICNFCGARLAQEETASDPTPEPQPTAPFAPRGARAQFPLEDAEVAPSEEGPRQRTLLGVLGYLAAAAIALAGGVWLALRLSSENAEQQVAAKTSPSAVASPAPAIASPLVALAKSLPIQVTGDGASAPERDVAAARKLFEDHKEELLAAYERALGEDGKAADGMVLRLHVLPDGTADRAAVRTSTSPNPSLDVDVVKSALGWRFAPASGGSVEADYPVIFARGSSEAAKIESALQTHLASLAPVETSEYASIRAPVATAASTSAAPATPAPTVAAAPRPAGTPSPSRAASLAPAPATKPHPRPARKAVAAIPMPKPKPSLFDLVRERLRSDRRLKRVKFYTAGGTVTLYGEVFNENDKLLAERAVRGIAGVSNVVDTLMTDTARWAEEQARITHQLQEAGLDKVTVKVIGRDAFLNGSARTELEKQRAVTIAEGAAPVTVRENLIRVEPGGLFGF